MNVLIVNAGSSSLKYQLFDTENKNVLAKGGCERIGLSGGKVEHKVPGKEPYELATDMATHEDAIRNAFSVQPREGAVFLPHVMSRKKQVIPSLSALWG